MKSFSCTPDLPDKNLNIQRNNTIEIKMEINSEYNCPIPRNVPNSMHYTRNLFLTFGPFKG